MLTTQRSGKAFNYSVESLLQDLNDALGEQLQHVEKYGWDFQTLGFNNARDMLEGVDTTNDREHACFEQGFVNGLRMAIRILESRKEHALNDIINFTSLKGNQGK